MPLEFKVLKLIFLEIIIKNNIDNILIKIQLSLNNIHKTLSYLKYLINKINHNNNNNQILYINKIKYFEIFKVLNQIYDNNRLKN